MSNWNDSKYSNDDLADILSDYHKDVHGFRLRMAGSPRAELVAELDRLDQYREAHPDLAAELDRLYSIAESEFAQDPEYAEWSADLDAQHYANI
jgi:hypothetical protein